MKYRAALSVAYGAGLRSSEVISLKQGKGHKDRTAKLSPLLLDLLRAWWTVARLRGAYYNIALGCLSHRGNIWASTLGLIRVRIAIFRGRHETVRYTQSLPFPNCSRRETN